MTDPGGQDPGLAMEGLETSLGVVDTAVDTDVAEVEADTGAVAGGFITVLMLGAAASSLSVSEEEVEPTFAGSVGDL